MVDFSNLKVLVIGDCCLDVVTNGESTRLSPEAPVPIILNPSKEYSLGMAGNVALNLQKLGAYVDFYCIVGEDEEGYTIIELLNNEGITNNFSQFDSKNESPTTVKNRIMANGQQVARIDTEDFKITADEIFDGFVNGGFYNTNYYDLVIISDYNKGMITKESWKLLRPILEEINKGLFFVDTKKVDIFPFYEGMILFPNSKEMNAILEYNNCNNVEELRIELDTEFIVETKSENGAALYCKEFWPLYSAAHTSEVLDICGAGDTFIASFALHFSKYKSHFTAMEFANYCCSKVVKRKGTSPVLYEEVKDFDSSIRK